MRLGVNIDHVATLRNARGGSFPCPIAAAQIAKQAGADGITAHLREDRRHIKDADIYRLKNEVALPLNFEMAATNEMLKIALDVMPNACCIVPENRLEVTTEGGLNLADNLEYLTNYCAKIRKAGIRVSLFIDPEESAVKLAHQIGADIVELHTGEFCHNPNDAEFTRITNAAKACEKYDIECHAGHGLNFDTTKQIAAIGNIAELNIGHFIISNAIFDGLESTIKQFKTICTQ